MFDVTTPHEYATTLNKGHGRIERRECRTISDPACLEYLSTAGDWPGLRSVGVVRSERREGERVSVECRYYISSLESEAQRFLGATRSHWGIENSVHWVLDVSKAGSGTAPENMAIAARSPEPVAARQALQNLNQSQAKAGRMG